MTVGELKSLISDIDDNYGLEICVREPAGWMCPDGATVGVKKLVHGMDMHQGTLLIVPENELNIHDVDAWGKYN